MEHSTETQERKDHTSQQRRRWPFRHRVLAMILTLTMLLSSSGLITLAAQAEGEEEISSTTTESSETLTPTPSEDETDVEAVTETTTQEVADETSSEPSQEPSAEPSEATVTEETATQATIDGSAGDSDDAGVPAAASLDDDDDAAEETAEESEAVTNVSTPRRAAARSATTATGTVTADGNLDITNLLTSDTYIQIMVNGTYYTIDELNTLGLKVPKGAAIDMHLEWDKITGIAAGQKLVYQIPKDAVSNVAETDEPFAFVDNKGIFAGYVSISGDGLITVDIDSKYFKTWSANQGTDTLELDFLKIEAYGTLASSRGETSGNGDNKIVFKEATNAIPQSEVSFTIPFEYKNENSKVNVTKESKFDPAKQSITYTVKVSTPSENAFTAEDVVLTDMFKDSTYLVKESSNANGVYRDVKATLYTNTNDGANLTNGTEITGFALNRSSNGVLTIGDMEPDSVVVLTYTVKVTDAYFSTIGAPSIFNEAQATYNETCTSSGYSEQRCEGMAKITKSAGDIETDTNGNPYIPYTVKVTARGQVTNIKVNDVFTQNASAITKLEDVTASQGTAPEGSNKDLTWDVGTLSDGQTATLTYKAYLDPNAWSLATATSDGKAIQKTVTIKNQADLYVGDSLLGSVTVSKDITKTWVNKVGKKDESTSVLSYTVYVNGDPVAKDITSIYDQLDETSANAGAKINYPVTVKVYTSSNYKTQSLVKTLSLDMATPVTGLTATDSGWNLNLKTYDGGSLYQKGYYYVIEYTATGGGAKDVVNGAGLNRGDISYGEGTSIQVKTVSSDKYCTYVDYRAGYISWESTMSTNIDAGTVYCDWFDDDKVGDVTHWNSFYHKVGYWWFSMDDINAIEIYQGTELIYSQAQGVNKYDISIDPYDDKHTTDPYYRQPILIPYWTYTVNEDGTYTWTSDDTKYGYIGYIGFKITFGQAIDVEGEGKDKVIIKYNSSCSWENMYYFGMSIQRNTYKTDGNYSNWSFTTNNHCQWTLSSGITSTKLDKGQTISNYTSDVVKGGVFDATTGIITWKIYINRMGDMIGDATVEDILPAGLEYLDVSYDYNTNDGKTYVSSDFNTSNGNSSHGNIKKDGVTVEKLSTGETKLTVQLENLIGFNYNKTSYGDWWFDDGNIVLTVRTRVSDELLLKGGTASFQNAVTVTNDTMAGGQANDYATVNINLASENALKKGMTTYSSGTLLTYTLNINPNGEDLIYVPGEDKTKDVLEIMDVMGNKMSLATHKDDYFVVTGTKVDKTNNTTSTVTLTRSDSEKITGDQYYLAEVEGEEGKTTYKIIVPDGMALTITYKVTVDAIIGEKPDVTNTAYFVYQGLQPTETAKSAGGEITIARASAGTGASANPTFQIFKQDQFGNPVSGVEFTLYKVTVTDGEVSGMSEVTTKTTGDDGLATFGVDLALNENGVYCYVETKAPTGYVVDSTPTYFYFTEQGKNYIESTGLEATGIGYTDKVFEVTNSFEPANVTIPLQKTINKKEQETTNQFSFTLTLDKAPDGAEVYSDQLCSKEMTSATTSIEGSGTTAFDTLYFLKAGEYVFTLTENNLTQVEIDEGFAKDATAYTIKVTVGDDLKVTAATFANGDNSKTGDLTKGDVPVFNNTLTQTPVNVKLTATKVLKSTGENTGRTIQAGEFNFEVLEDGEVIATGTTEAGETTAKIDFDAITYTQDQLGKHYLTVREVTGTDFTVDYSTVTFVAIVEVEPVQGKAELTATVKYSTQLKENLDKNGNPIFTNSYTPITPTGIPTEFMPFAVMAVMAGSIGAVVMVRRWKRRLAGK